MNSDNENAINDTFGYSRIIKSIFQVKNFDFACCMQLCFSLFYWGKIIGRNHFCNVETKRLDFLMTKIYWKRRIYSRLNDQVWLRY